MKYVKESKPAALIIGIYLSKPPQNLSILWASLEIVIYFPPKDL